MVRTYVRKRTSPIPSEELLQCAVREVVEKRMKIREAANYFDLSKSTVGNYVSKIRATGSVIPEQLKRSTFYQQIFSQKQEHELAEYLKRCSLMSHGLTPLTTRKLAYSFAVANGVQYLDNWKVNEAASRDWFSAFRKRNTSLSIRAPENTSQSRTSAFNKPVVSKFLENLKTVMVQHEYPPFKIWNADETGIPTVLPSPKVVATKGLKQVNQAPSQERGVNTTMLAFISAGGTQIPPVFVFPRKHFRPEMTRGGPAGSLGLAHPSGWINSDTFLESLKHFVSCTGCCNERPHLLLLDNHSSHLDLKVINFARDNGLVVLTFPPHCSHRLQPLDVSIVGPFKGGLRTVFNDWLDLHPGGRITIHQIAELARKPYERAFTPSNIISGYTKTNIFPFDRDVFSEQDFLPSFSTDRPLGNSVEMVF